MFKFVNEMQYKEYIGFTVADEWYCINIGDVNEIIFIPPISKIPNVPEYIEGAINLRGKIIQVINLRKWFKFSWKPYTKDSRILILELHNKFFGILVDSVSDVFQIDDNSRKITPNIILKNLKVNYLKSIIFQNNENFIEIDTKIISKI